MRRQLLPVCMAVQKKKIFQNSVSYLQTREILPKFALAICGNCGTVFPPLLPNGCWSLCKIPGCPHFPDVKRLCWRSYAMTSSPRLYLKYGSKMKPAATDIIMAGKIMRYALILTGYCVKGHKNPEVHPYKFPMNSPPLRKLSNGQCHTCHGRNVWHSAGVGCPLAQIICVSDTNVFP